MTDSNIPEIPQPPAPSERSENADDRQVIQPYVDPEVLAEDARAAERRKHRRRMSHEHIRRIKRKKRIRMVLIVIGALLLIIAALAAWLGLSALKAKNEVEAAIQAASRIQSQVQAGDTDKAQASIEAFSQHIDATYAQTKQPVWKLATLVPYYGSDVKAARAWCTFWKTCRTTHCRSLPRRHRPWISTASVSKRHDSAGGYGQRGSGSCRANGVVRMPA